MKQFCPAIIAASKPLHPALASAFRPSSVDLLATPTDPDERLRLVLTQRIQLLNRDQLLRDLYLGWRDMPAHHLASVAGQLADYCESVALNQDRGPEWGGSAECAAKYRADAARFRAMVTL